MKLFWRMGHRWNEARYRRALKRGDLTGATIFKARSEKFFRQIREQGSEH